MKRIFVDTSGLYAAIDTDDRWCATARALFTAASAERWHLLTTNYVVHETAALIQRRLGWEELDGFLTRLLPSCEVHFVDADLHSAAITRWQEARLRDLSLTDCSSFEFMRREGLNEAIAFDRHFADEGVALP